MASEVESPAGMTIGYAIGLLLGWLVLISVLTLIARLTWALVCFWWNAGV